MWVFNCTKPQWNLFTTTVKGRKNAACVKRRTQNPLLNPSNRQKTAWWFRIVRLTDCTIPDCALVGALCLGETPKNTCCDGGLPTTRYCRWPCWHRKKSGRCQLYKRFWRAFVSELLWHTAAALYGCKRTGRGIVRGVPRASNARCFYQTQRSAARKRGISMMCSLACGASLLWRLYCSRGRRLTRF